MTNLTHEQLVERVAVEICQAGVGELCLAVWSPEMQEVFRRQARSAIATIAEATKERGELARVKSNANHIARMDPLTTLALIARIRELEAKSAADLADYETSLETMTAAREAKVRELEAENAVLQDRLDERVDGDCALVGMLQDCGKETANILAAQIRSLITKEGE